MLVGKMYESWTIHVDLSTGQTRVQIHEATVKAEVAVQSRIATLMQTFVLFAYMIVQVSPHSKTRAFVGSTPYPIISTQLHNSGSFRNTAHAAGRWMTETIVGPFESISECKMFEEQWKTGSKGIESKARKARSLIAQWNLDGGKQLILFDRSSTVQT